MPSEHRKSCGWGPALRILAWSFCLCAAGCGLTSYFWVSGLSLPEGSRSVARSVVENPTMGLPPLFPGGSFSELLSVSFNHDGGWDRATGHIGGCLLKEGYTEQLSSQAIRDAAQSGAGRDPAELIRVFTKQDGDFAVWLVNIAATLDDADVGTRGDSLQSFTLYVGRLKSEEEKKAEESK